jgi:hypothetical protein
MATEQEKLEGLIKKFNENDPSVTTQQRNLLMKVAGMDKEITDETKALGDLLEEIKAKQTQIQQADSGLVRKRGVRDGILLSLLELLE